MKKMLILLLALSLTLLCFTGCGKDLTVRSKLEAGTVVSQVKLSRGELRFKTEEEALAQFADRIDETKARIADLRKATDVTNSFMNYPEMEAQVPVKELLGIRPEGWVIPARLTESRESYHSIYIHADPDRTLSILEGDLYACTYSADLSAGAGADMAFVRVRAPGQEILQMPDPNGLIDLGEAGSAALLSPDCLVGARYGDRDSRAGNLSLSIVCGERLGRTYFDAYFTRGNGDWIIYTLGLTQAEFLDLLLSILAQPEPEAADVSAWLLTGVG